MSSSALVMMFFSMIVLWGVAGWAFVTSLRCEESKKRLQEMQGGYELFCPRAYRDLEKALAESTLSAEQRRDFQKCHDQQVRALQLSSQRLYDWSEPSERHTG